MTPPPAAGAEELAVSVRRLSGQVAHWTLSQWAASGASGVPRADLVHALIQRLADACAEVEGRPGRVVPRLASDLVLPDQLTVVAADLIAVAPPQLLRAAVDRVVETRATLRRAA